MNPKISIIIPTYNRAKLIGFALDSILAQNYQNWECIIINDHSSDSYEDIISRFTEKDERIKLLYNPKEKKGPSSCRNYGLEIAKGEYIQFFDDDDIMYPEMLLKKISYAMNEEVDVVVSTLDIFNFSKGKISGQNKVKSDNLIEDYILGKISWYVSGPLWRKEFLKEEFDESVQTLDDWDFNLRNIYNNPFVKFLDEALFRYNRFEIENSLSRTKISRGKDQTNSVFIVYKKHYSILKKNGLLNEEIKMCLMKRLSSILRTALINKNPASKSIFLFLLQENELKEFPKILRICIGYLSFVFFRKGYRLIKY